MSNSVSAMTRRSMIAATSLGIIAGASPAIGGKTRHRKGEMIKVLKAIIDGWHNHDVEAVLAHVTDDIVWRNSGGYRPAVKGKAAMRTVLQTMAPLIETSAWRTFDYAELQDRVFVEGVDEFWTKSGNHVAIPYAGVFVFRGSLVSEWREYFDGRISAEMKSGGRITDEIKEMISRPAI